MDKALKLANRAKSAAAGLEVTARSASSLSGTHIMERPNIEAVLRNIGGSKLARSYVRSFSMGVVPRAVKGNEVTPVKFTTFGSASGIDVKKISRTLDGGRVAITKKSQEENIVRVIINDVPKVGERKSAGNFAIVTSDEEVTIKFGDKGKTPLAGVPVRETLIHEIKVAPNTVGVASVEPNTPVAFEGNKDNTVVVPACEIAHISPGPINVEEKYSLSVICELTPVTAKSLLVALQGTVFEDRAHEYFYAEVTLPVVKPTSSLPNSVTLMNFEASEYQNDTPMHRHPGSRLLYIITTGKKAGVIINGCGANENPEDKPEYRREIKFKPNSISIFRMEEDLNHDFYGDFFAFSVHPREGERFTKLIESGQSVKGFLETLTFVSGGKEYKMPAATQVNEDISKEENPKKGNSR